MAQGIKVTTATLGDEFYFQDSHGRKRESALSDFPLVSTCALWVTVLGVPFLSYHLIQGTPGLQGGWAQNGSDMAVS